MLPLPSNMVCRAPVSSKIRVPVGVVGRGVIVGVVRGKHVVVPGVGVGLDKVDVDVVLAALLVVDVDRGGVVVGIDVGGVELLGAAGGGAQVDRPELVVSVTAPWTDQSESAETIRR